MAHHDERFGQEVKWDIPLLGGYRHEFLSNVSPSPNPSRFWGLINPAILQRLRMGNFDAVWIHGWALASNCIAWATAASRHLPILLRGETNGMTEPVGIKRIAKKILLREFFSHVSGFLAIGTNNANFYRLYDVSDRKIFMTPYSVDNAFFMGRAQDLEDQKRVLKEKEGIPANSPVILFCGKLYAVKRPLDILKAFALLEPSLRASLVFVGDGPLRAEMERFVAQQRVANVFFLGFRNQQELPRCYALADLLVLSSASETWGVVLNEAMCSKLPLIVSDRVGAAVDLVRNGINGFIYPMGNIEALTECMRRVIKDDEVRKEMGLSSLEIIKRWGPEESVKGVLKCLEAVVQ
jgi:glycosyltransferase involved in cell wall biosynthesis